MKTKKHNKWQSVIPYADLINYSGGTGTGFPFPVNTERFFQVVQPNNLGENPYIPGSTN